MKHETSKGDQMQPSHRSGKPLIVTRQAPKPRDPGKGTLHHPSSRQQDEAAFGLGQLDDCQLDALRGRRLSRVISGVGLVDDVPGWQVMRHHVPGGSRAHHPAQAIKHFSQLVMPLSGIFGQQRQIRGDEGPFLVAHIAWIGISRVHAIILSWLRVRIPNRL